MLRNRVIAFSAKLKNLYIIKSVAREENQVTENPA